MRKYLFAVAAMVLSAGIGYAAGIAKVPDLSTLNPRAFKYTLPEDIKWAPAAGIPGAESATLVGDQAKPGFYVVVNRFHPGSSSRPHYHPNDRYIMVLKGTWWAATGAKYDPNSTVPIKSGTFVVHPGREVHYDGASMGNEDAVVMIFGMGPGTRQDCEGPAAEQGPGPCEEARKAAAPAN
jgi:quercetin dioxygenase-like cupin family protein